MELTYRMVGDYLLPKLAMPEAPRVGKYGMLHLSFLRKHRNGIYTGLFISGRLNRHLEEIDRQAAEMVNQLIEQMAEAEGVTEELKAADQMRWVGLMNNIKERAEEVVLKELIYV